MIRIAVDLPPQHCDFADLRRAALEAEEGGADIVFTWDHFFPLSGDPQGKHLECWTVLAALAEATRRVELGPLVSCIGYRNPNLLADMARTVDHVSGGRVILGLGSGWCARDYQEYGYAFGTAGSRLRDLEAALPVLRHRLERLNPPPLRRMPLLIGGVGEKVTLRLVAEHADIWHGLGEPRVLAHKARVLDDWCARVGRDPGTLERSTSIFDLDRLELGDELVELGFRCLVLELKGPAFDMAPLARWVRWRDRLKA
ncbi:MAG TPA: LLM class F420-dependent oxidoreductase [Candidatus Nitrosotenuis sp.]|nr:LLM class F420-dependent oxidoreductase [Candidatus Nitrosotenuis sp.]